MSDTPTKAQIIDATRGLVLRDGAKFSIESICRQLNCSRSHLRRYFPTKANLIAAVFNNAFSETPEKATSNANATQGRAFHASINAEKDLIERRFRIFERAVAILEGQIETIRSDSASSFARLDKTLAHLIGDPKNRGAAFLSDLHREADPKRDDGGSALELKIIEKTSFADDAPSKHTGMFNTTTSARSSIAAATLSAADNAEDLYAEGLDIVDERNELNFITAPEQAPSNESWKETLVLGFAVFLGALAVVTFSFVITSRAGTKHSPENKDPGHNEMPNNRASAVRNWDLIERIKLANCSATNPPAAIFTESLPRSPPTKALHLDQTLSADNNASLQSLKCDPKLKSGYALAYLRGEGVKADPMMAAVWSESAAQQGSADAQYILGTLYAEGIKPDSARAYQWFASAAVQGNTKAMHNLAIALLNGTGVAKNQSSAVYWFVRAANLGYRDSAFNLGVLYERGEGVAQNPRKALYWYDFAAATGDTQAIERAELLRANGFPVVSRN